MKDLDPNAAIAVTLTRVLGDGVAVISLEGAVTLPIGAVVETWEQGKPVGYVIDAVRLRHEDHQAGLYYDAHRL